MGYKRHTLRTGSATEGRVGCTDFLGIDCSVSSSEVSISRADGKSYFNGAEAPGTVNFIRTGLGEISKRPGFVRIDGTREWWGLDSVHKYMSSKGEICFYVKDVLVTRSNSPFYFVMPENYDGCASFQADDYMVFMKGDSLTVCDLVTMIPSYLHASDGKDNLRSNYYFYTPTVIIGGKPDGTGELYQAESVISPYVREEYAGDGSSLEFTLHNGIKEDLKVYIKNIYGEWRRQEKVSYSGNKVTFETAPPAPDVIGEDNVRFEYRKQNHFNLSRFLGRNRFTRFGVNGAGNRVFLASDKDNVIYYSDANNQLYFPDINYITVGTLSTRVYGLSCIDDKLFVICNDGIYVIKGESYDNVKTPYFEAAVFKVTGMINTPTPVNVPPVIFDNEVVYLTKSGVCALTPSGVLDERCAQIRSSFIGGCLMKENLDKCTLDRYGDFLTVFNGKDTIYLLDGKRFTVSEEMPFSLRQYEGYVWKIHNSKLVWSIAGERLLMSDGVNLFELSKGESNHQYRDDYMDADGNIASESIRAYWETPYVYCSDFAPNKLFNRLGILLEAKYGEDGSPLNTDIKVYAKFDNEDWCVIKDYDGKRSIFRYNSVDYGRFVYRDKAKSFVSYSRLPKKKGKSVKLRFENTNRDEPVTLQGFYLEYLLM